MSPPRPVTLGDVAARAGVSVSTVSRALAGDPQISAATHDRVRRLADELGYVPNIAARTLVKQRSTSLGLLTPDVTDPFHGQVVTGFQQRAAERGFSVVLANGLGDAATERGALRELAAHRVGGVAALGCVLGADEVVDLLSPTPTVLVAPEGAPPSRRGRAGAGVLRADERDAMRQVVRHLHETGYRRPCFVGGPGGATQTARLEAFVAALAEAGHPRPLVYRAEGWSPAALALVADRVRLDAADVAVCYDDKTALYLLDALRSLGLSVPADLGVVGFDDIPFAGIANPRLTTVAQQSEALGRHCVDLLLGAMESGRPVRSAVLPVSLVARESTARPDPPRAGRTRVRGDRPARRRTAP